MNLLNSLNLPGPDFILPKPLATFANWVDCKICSFADGLRAMRVLLMSGANAMTVEQAVLYSLHSWRHFMPICSRQLAQASDATTEIGHWEVGSAMPATYDSVACGKELLHKSQILSSLKMGWRPVADGEIPWNAPAPDPELMKGDRATNLVIACSHCGEQENCCCHFCETCNVVVPEGGFCECTDRLPLGGSPFSLSLIHI